MDQVLSFKNGSYYNDRDPETITIQGEQFRALMDLCFAHADRFSLLRSGWPGANDGQLEQALRPFCLGEYRSYGAICVPYDYNKRIWESCYLYPATDETRGILLRFIPHLFGREPDPVPEGHTAYLEQKYAAYNRTASKASEKVFDFLDNYYSEHSGSDDDAFAAFWSEAYREANAIWKQIFDPKDYYSVMEDPCFFRGDEMFFETVTHERDCFAHVFSDEFGVKLRELGEWVDVSDRSRLPLFSLKKAKKLVLY